MTIPRSIHDRFMSDPTIRITRWPAPKGLLVLLRRGPV